PRRSPSVIHLRLDLREKLGAFYLLPDPVPLQSARMLARSILVALMFALLAGPAALQRWVGGDTAPYIVTTIVLVVITLALVLSWPHEHDDQPVEISSPMPTAGRSFWGTTVVAAAAAALLFVTCRTWLDQILTIPLDPFRGDMLVLVREGVR